jgi:hypothetical protein
VVGYQQLGAMLPQLQGEKHDVNFFITMKTLSLVQGMIS